MPEAITLENTHLRLFDIPVRLIERGGSFGGFEKESSAFEKYLIPSNQLLAFVAGNFPPPRENGNVLTQVTAAMPGLSPLRADRVTWKAHTEGLPIDPFDTDLAADSRTYKEIIEVTVQYLAKEQPDDDDDPRTFLEISANTTGEFIHGGGAQCWWNEQRITTQSAAVRNKRKTIPVPIIVPQTEWSLRWPRIPGDFFEDLLIQRLRTRMGKVNSKKMPILFNAEIETVMFVGFDYREQPTFTGDSVNTLVRSRFVEVVMKFLQKHQEDADGNTRGHNDFWKEGVGWQYLLCGTDAERTSGTLKPIHSRIDMNGIFELGHGTCTYNWDGAAWQLFESNCVDEGYICGAAPTDAGTTVGERQDVPCILP